MSGALEGAVRFFRFFCRGIANGEWHLRAGRREGEGETPAGRRRCVPDELDGTVSVVTRCEDDREPPIKGTVGSSASESDEEEEEAGAQRALRRAAAREPPDERDDETSSSEPLGKKAYGSSD